MPLDRREIRSTRNRIRLLESHSEVLRDYLVSKYHMRDWHAVSDAANDLREIAAQLRVLKKKCAPLSIVIKNTGEE